MKQGDRETIMGKQMPSMVLMERAALACVEVMEEAGTDFSNVLVVCGSGNNGGDGYAIARLLHLKGYRVTVVLAGKESSMSEETMLQRAILKNYGISDVNNIPPGEYSVIIDAVFGIGLSREIRGAYCDIIEKMNQMSGVKAAVDIPSGVSSFDGKILGTAFQADMTITFACEKYGMAFYPGRSFCGQIFVKDIGICTDLFDEQEEVAYTYEREDLPKLLKARVQDSHKGTYGKLLMITGSRGMSGAAYLSAKAAYRAGAGLVKIYTEESNRIILQQLLPEAMVETYESSGVFAQEKLLKELSWADAVLIGCGIGTGDTARKMLRTVLTASDLPCVIDADGLNLLAEEITLLAEGFKNTAEKTGRDMILTPHMKEMSRLLHCTVKELQDDRKELLRGFTEDYPVICALKDARTLVRKKGHHPYVNLTGNAAMAKGGSGDVLAGIIAGLLVQRMDAYDAAAAGVWIHGLAGDAAKEDKGEYSVLAGDIIEALAEVLRK